MVIMSMASWYIIFTKLFEQRSMLMKSAEAACQDPSGPPARCKAGIGNLAKKARAFRFIAEQRRQRQPSTMKARWSRSIDQAYLGGR